jgi:hypothetical protein
LKLHIFLTDYYIRTCVKSKNSTEILQIDKRQQEGYRYTCCPSCQFEAFWHEDLGHFNAGKCEVCEIDHTLKGKCVKCHHETILTGQQEVSCQYCHHVFSADELCDILDENYGIYRDVKHGDPENIAWCRNCETDTVVYIRNSFTSGWFCTNCFEIFADGKVFPCNYCNTLIAGGNKDNYFEGCFMCDGHSGELMAKDD